jgi:hypothetical protein
MKMRVLEFYLAGPPPPSTVHLGEDPGFFVWTSVVFFRGMSQELRKFWVTVEELDAFEYVTVVELIFLPLDLNFLSNELW